MESKDSGLSLSISEKEYFSSHGLTDEFLQVQDFRLPIEKPPFLPPVFESHGVAVIHYFVHLSYSPVLIGVDEF